MTVQELIDVLAEADPTWDICIEFEDLSGWELGKRLEEQYAVSVRIGANKCEDVVISTQPLQGDNQTPGGTDG